VSKARMAVLLTAVAAALAAPSAASGVNYFYGTLAANTRAWSGYNYWFATDAYKGCYCLGGIGFRNSVAEKGYADDSGYMYFDKTMQGGIGGYMRAFSENYKSFGVFYDSHVCTC
jgi:hypothetical protein